MNDDDEFDELLDELAINEAIIEMLERGEIDPMMLGDDIDEKNFKKRV